MLRYRRLELREKREMYKCLRQSLVIASFALAPVTGAFAQDRPGASGAERARSSGVRASEPGAGAADKIKSRQQDGTAVGQDADTRFGDSGADISESNRSRGGEVSGVTAAKSGKRRIEPECRERLRVGDRFQPTSPKEPLSNACV